MLSELASNSLPHSTTLKKKNPPLDVPKISQRKIDQSPLKARPDSKSKSVPRLNRRRVYGAMEISRDSNSIVGLLALAARRQHLFTPRQRRSCHWQLITRAAQQTEIQIPAYVSGLSRAPPNPQQNSSL